MVKIIFGIIFGLGLIVNTAWSQTTIIKWYKDKNGMVYCGEFTPDNDYIKDVKNNMCRDKTPSYFSWYMYKNRYVYCGEYTPTPQQDLIGDADIQICRNVQPSTPKWYKHANGYVYCGEHSPQGFVIRDLDHDVCRNPTLYSIDNGYKKSTLQSSPKLISVAEIIQNLQPEESTQVIISDNLAIPRNMGCAAPQDANGNVQCYVCQAESARISMLYTKESILGLGEVQMTESRNEINITLVDSDDLGSIRCLSKNKGIINVTAYEQLVKILNESGIKLKEPGSVVKTIGVKK